MTEEELKGTEEYKAGQKIVGRVWAEDKDKLRGNVEVYSKTLDLLQTIWKEYKRNIENMSKKEFWLFPEGLLTQAAINSGEVKGAVKADTLEWFLDICDSIMPGNPSYGTICKALIQFSDLYDRFWKEKYCKLISENGYNDYESPIVAKS